MATPLDLGILQNVQIIFPFLLVLVFVYAILQFFPPLKDKPAFCGIVALSLAFMTVMSRVALKTINLMSPWFVLIMVFGVLAILAYQSMGVGHGTILKVITEGEYSTDFAIWMLAIILIIGVGSFFTVITQESGGVPGPDNPTETAGAKVVTTLNQTGSQQSAFFNTIFHPKVLGMALILLIAMLAVQKLTQKE